MHLFFVQLAEMQLTVPLPQAANALIMNKGTPRNILTQLNMTSDEYNFVSTVYFVRSSLICILDNMTADALPDTIHRIRNPV
jgi:hypothetical protein